MQYEGPLYAKIGRKYLRLVETSEDFDALKMENERLRAKIAHLTTLEMVDCGKDGIAYYCRACKNYSGKIKTKGV